MVEFAEEAANLGKIVIISALNSDFRKQAWPSISSLMPLAEKVKNISSICKVCGANASFTFKHDAGAQQASAGKNIEIGGADLYMPLCRECFNEKTKQQQKLRDLSPSALADSNNKGAAAFGSSTTLAESNQNDNSVHIDGTNSSGASKCGAADQMSSSETQKNSASGAPLLDMKQARSVLEGDSDMKQAGQQPKEVNRFFDENTSQQEFTDGIHLRNAKKQKTGSYEDHLLSEPKKVVLRDMQNLQYSGSKVMSFTNSQHEMTEEESLRFKKPTQNQ